MAKTSISVRPCNIGSAERHNLRSKELDYIRPDLTKNNESLVGKKISECLTDIKRRYQATTGQRLQKKATPIREGVVVIQKDTTMQQLQNFANRIEEKWGIKTIQIYTHKDEGADAWDGNKEAWKPNYHAHMVFDWTQEDGRSIKLNKQDMVQMQTILAECLGMERGVSSDVKHLSAIQYKNHVEAEKAARLKAEIADMEDFKNLKANPISVKEDFSLLSKEQQVSLLQELSKIASEPARQEEKKTVVFSTEGRTLTIGKETAIINLRGKDYDASGILSEFKRINVNWRSISPSKIESLLRGKEITLVSRGKQLSLRLQKGIGGYVLKSALSVVTTITEAGANER